MKKLTCCLLLSVFITPAYANSNLPFVGTKYFEFSWGSARTTTGSITIKKNGDTVIKTESCGHPDTGDCEKETTYKGKYKQTMGDYRIVSKTQIAYLDENGKIDDSCLLSTCQTTLENKKFW